MTQPSAQKNIVLTGFMGTGKTTVGRLLADQLSYRFVDTDVLIEAESGQTIAAIFATHGEPYFRQLEQEMARKLAQTQATVVATGGRMMLDPANKRSFSPTSYIFCLSAPPQEILRRVLSDEKRIERPLLNVPDPEARIQQLLTERATLYQQYPQVETVNRTPSQIVAEILRLIA